MSDTSPTPAAQPRRSYWLRRKPIDDVLDEKLWKMEALAKEIGISRVLLSRLVHRHRCLTRSTRRKFVECGLFEGVPQETLWDNEPAGD